MLCSGSSNGRITRSMVWLRTMFVNWSQESKIPVSVLPSAVRIRTFSKKDEILSNFCSLQQMNITTKKKLTADIGVERHPRHFFRYNLNSKSGVLWNSPANLTEIARLNEYVVCICSRIACIELKKTIGPKIQL